MSQIAALLLTRLDKPGASPVVVISELPQNFRPSNLLILLRLNSNVYMRFPNTQYIVKRLVALENKQVILLNANPYLGRVPPN